MVESTSNTLRGNPALAFEPGEVLAQRYRVDRLLMKGGGSILYEGTDQMLERPVAIKVRAALDDENRADYERFEREAKAAAKIVHPNVVSVFDMGIHEATERPFIIMELLEGRDLSRELAEHGPLERARALTLLRKALEAISLGHALGIVHKDLKPANFFLTAPRTPEEDLRLLDFGTASMNVTGARTTATGHATGQPEYLAPEFIDDQTVSPALDVYQMALVFIEMLTGKPAVRGETPLACVSMHQSGKVSLPRVLLESPLEKILIKALATDPEVRIPDARAFLKALKPIRPEDIPLLSGGEREIFLCVYLAPPTLVSIPAPAVAVTAEDLKTPRRDNPAQWIFIGALIMAVVAVFLVGGLNLLSPSGRKAKPSASGALAQKPVAPDEPPEAPEPPPAPEASRSPEALPQVLLITTPTGASVFKGERDMGKSPLNIQFDDLDAGSVTLTLKRQGYQDARIDLSPSGGLRQEVALKRLRVPPRFQKTPPSTGGGMGLAD